MFEYTRKTGEKRTYRIKIELMGKAGNFRYKASIYHGDDFKGHGVPFDLTALESDAAMMEALGRVEDDIERLVGVDE